MELTKEQAINALQQMQISVMRGAETIYRKRSLRPSEKAMALADNAKRQTALRMAIAALKVALIAAVVLLPFASDAEAKRRGRGGSSHHYSNARTYAQPARAYRNAARPRLRARHFIIPMMMLGGSSMNEDVLCVQYETGPFCIEY